MWLKIRILPEKYQPTHNVPGDAIRGLPNSKTPRVYVCGIIVEIVKLGEDVLNSAVLLFYRVILRSG